MVEPLSFYSNDSEPSLKFYVIDCGQGSMNLIVFPNSTVMLFDCNVTNDNKDEILDFLNYVIPRKANREKNIDVFVNSHRDDDHLHGIKDVDEKFPIKSIWDSGQSGNTKCPAYQDYMALKLDLKHEAEKKVRVLVPTNVPINSSTEQFGGANIYCLSAKADYQDSKSIAFSEEAVKPQHNNCIVLLVEYAGRKLLLTGDSDWKSWRDDIAPHFGNKSKYPNYSNIAVLVASHHGSRSFFTDENKNENIDERENPDNTYLGHIRLMKPTITLISCGEYKIHHHPNENAVELYKKYTPNEQVYTTHNFGTFDGIIKENGEFTVVPDFFKNTSNSFEIVCNSGNVKNGGSYKTRLDLKFTLNFYNSISEYNSAEIDWIISNGGTGADFKHQEIEKTSFSEDDDFEKKKKFTPELVYRGTHLLLCRIKNMSAREEANCVFKITGI